mmetsp:Transcript_30937/g.46948  ORF Transcript_30937/g.46948 Transcript_30937/m.46948 type:complete len:97 (+) Transcript_30937:3-293(+)
MTSNSIVQFDHSNILLEPINAQHTKNNNDIPPPRKLRRVSTEESYNRIRTDEIERRKTHRRSPCVLVGWRTSQQGSQISEQRHDNEAVEKEKCLAL